MTIGEVAKLLGVTVHTLRYYEQIGLIRDVARSGGKRIYTEPDVSWLEFIQRLKRTKMPLKEIRRYSELRHEGNHTISQRKEMLLQHRHRLQDEISALQDHLGLLGEKIKLYEKLEKEYEPLPKRTSKA